MNTNIPEILNPLQHNGTNKFERLATEMDFDYVQIEERHESDFLKYAHKLTTAFQYYDQNNQPFGNWQSFFADDVPTNRPHKALFIAFLRLLEALNEHANGLTKRHLDFYYREVLQFVDREAKPSHLHLFFKCAKTLKERFIEKDAKLVAGENKEGKKILYKLVDEIVVNQATLSNYYTVYKHSDAFNNRLFTKNYTNLVIEGSENQNGIPCFGEHQLINAKDALATNGYRSEFNTEFSMEKAEIGFAISTPVLRMEEGKRVINLSIEIDNLENTNFTNSLFNFYVSTQDGWYALKEAAIAATTNSKSLHLVITLNNTNPAIVNYDQEIHLGNYATDFPILRVLLNNNSDYAYLDWKNIGLTNAKLWVNVTGVRSLIVQNELSTLDPSKPFRPFGPIPSIGNHFYIGHADIFKNKLQNVSVNIKWKDIDNNKLSNHYANYSEPINETSFKVKTAVLDNKEWTSLSSEISLFDSNNPIGFDFSKYSRKSNYETLTDWNYKTINGFVRMTLTSPNKTKFQAFGHSIYSKEIMRLNTYNQTHAPKLEINQPYTPVAESLTLNYTTTEIIFDLSQDDQFYHVEPYGQKKISLNESPLIETNLLPQFKHEGEFYIGLKAVNTPQSISLLFQLAEGTGNADQSQIKTGIKWYYLVNNEWKKLDRLRISKDTTRNLLNTGIIRFDLPKEMNDVHQIMPTNLFWIKATMPEKTVGLDRIQKVHIQAAEAIELNPEINDEIITPNTIKKLKGGGSGIAEINQPFASFGGTNLDTNELFYARITERLRHKDRGVMIWDYERLVVDAFPNIYKVKCLNHTNYKTELVAGHVMLALIPNLRNKGIKNPFQPKLSIHKRTDIYDYLRKRISPFIYLRVENPIYEPIQLSFNVDFHKGYDEGFYGKKLHQELQEFLSPWAFENELTEKSDLVFGGSLHKSTILKFMEDLEYVDFVNHFNMYHIYKDPRVVEDFATLNLNANNYYSESKQEGACNRIKMELFTDNPNELSTLLNIKLRFLKGLLDISDSKLEEKFNRELYKSIKRRADKGETITKTLIQILVKNMYYVDKVLSLKFYKILPDNFIMEDVDVAIAKTSRSIMVTANQHRIGVYRAGDFNCEGSIVIGIGFMIVEADFIIPEIKEINYEHKAR